MTHTARVRKRTNTACDSHMRIASPSRICVEAKSASCTYARTHGLTKNRFNFEKSCHLSNTREIGTDSAVVGGWLNSTRYAVAA